MLIILSDFRLNRLLAYLGSLSAVGEGCTAVRPRQPRTSSYPLLPVRLVFWPPAEEKPLKDGPEPFEILDPVVELLHLPLQMSQLTQEFLRLHMYTSFQR